MVSFDLVQKINWQTCSSLHNYLLVLYNDLDWTRITNLSSSVMVVIIYESERNCLYYHWSNSKFMWNGLLRIILHRSFQNLTICVSSSCSFSCAILHSEEMGNVETKDNSSGIISQRYVFPLFCHVSIIFIFRFSSFQIVHVNGNYWCFSFDNQ